MIKQQLEMQSRINLVDMINMENVNTVTGIDSAYFKFKDNEYAVCCAVTIDRETKKIIDTNNECGEVNLRYISGLLSFREEEITLRTWNNLKNKGDVIFFDGNGVLHERKMGIATHAGIILNKPTVGIAKTYYKIKDIEICELGENEFEFRDIEYDGFTYGRVLRTKVNCKPIYVSCGSNITLDSATKLAIEFIGKESRVPIPTRLADLETHKYRAEVLSRLNGGY